MFLLANLNNDQSMSRQGLRTVSTACWLLCISLSSPIIMSVFCSKLDILSSTFFRESMTSILNLSTLDDTDDTEDTMFADSIKQISVFPQNTNLLISIGQKCPQVVTSPMTNAMGNTTMQASVKPNQYNHNILFSELSFLSFA